ncbi:4-diphosphocytidyl-2-C-methyl-D-erythritol kinase [[Clostridium] ultunense Esp]|uniref:4-diphosphocytidyl-2-C-methyl-D-erythritol kinase n=1 Tax=[Clostridium] ultunense Esp TaxID=1288971 RepID=M1ZIU9_9FIRM|nr:4-(cytidine 5'-diphospho)-2-C-methyl-D-erythritol kinase [Schnuerera ultunensis]CCQ93892.1 4-diphosphocytidyl-2-C-methyl-D-erythritol kinase [[Clostridium] ultunense Esp]SHD76181.1 4-(cytidine 5'-diphospho)-2-C-methyl-D-erythritol kinase [[Clostridium] ultunense Esp]
MDEIVLESFGKINLALDVLYKRDDGYHEINTLMQQIDLKDRIIIKNREKGIEIQCNDKDVPLDNTNLVYRAWEKIIEKTGVNKGAHIIIDKKIPVAAGLAGGSSNGAAVLKGLNLLWNLDLSEKQLMEIGLEIGADIPFCILGGTAWAKGVGEKLTKLKNFSNKMVLLANVGIPISTASVYNNLDLKGINTEIHMEKMIKYMEEDNLPKLAKNMANVMEGVVIKKYPIIGEIKKDMIRCGALGSIMSGSGPTVFGLFDDEEKLYRCKEELEGKIPKVLVAKTI